MCSENLWRLGPSIGDGDVTLARSSLPEKGTESRWNRTFSARVSLFCYCVLHRQFIPLLLCDHDYRFVRERRIVGHIRNHAADQRASAERCPRCPEGGSLTSDIRRLRARPLGRWPSGAQVSPHIHTGLRLDGFFRLCFINLHLLLTIMHKWSFLLYSVRKCTLY